MWRRKRGSARGPEYRAWERAAAAGDVDAMFHLGMLAVSQTPPDLDAARSWLGSAAAGGEVRAMDSLASLHLQLVQPPDIDTARYWYYRAAEAGDISATFNMGVLASTSDPPDRDAAQSWWQRAADAGHATAMACLGEFYTDSDPPDLDAARHWLERAAAAGHPAAMYRLGVIAMDWPDLSGLDEAIGWYEKAAAAGHTGAMFALGTLYEHAVEPLDLDAARRWYRSAAAAGHGSAAKSLEALTASWTTPDGWGEKPPDGGQIRAMAEWLERHAATVDEVIDAAEPALDDVLEALRIRSWTAIRASCDSFGTLFVSLTAVTPTPDPDLTEAIRSLAGVGDRLRGVAASTPDNPGEHDVEPAQGAIADIGPSLGRLAAIYGRDSEIVASGDS